MKRNFSHLNQGALIRFLINTIICIIDKISIKGMILGKCTKWDHNVKDCIQTHSQITQEMVI